MTERPVANVAASVRQRLLNLSQAMGADYNAVLAQYAIERFLYRLSKSTLADRFVLKGAMLFRVWAKNLYRPTKDLDLLGFGSATLDEVAAAIRTIIATPVPDDGLMFDAASVTVTEIREGQEYGGIRASVLATLGNAHIRTQVDIGFGDVVIPSPNLADFPALLGHEAPKLKMYPPEAVVAEKLEAIVSLGMANSRMKDYYDLLVILRLHDCKSPLLPEAIAATFRRRKTALPRNVPAGLSAAFARDPIAQRRWPEFLQRLGIEDAPANLGEVIKTIWARLKPAMKQARERTRRA